ncbi:30S ribosomal protein S5 [Candidatus Peregrinibacteria bacterium RIFCSPLOWO2_02_FULL_39_10]|nr:MAG: 30S ribosomal protein S5 [Candidatus Peregrinibacteria bacterium RIFCSPLOWO2_02_FULL_39_10]
MSRPASKRGGFVHREPKEFEEEVIQIDRVTRVVKGGRKLRFRATVAIGNKKGRVGLGIGKSNEVTGAIQKAIAKAKKNMLTVVMNGTTIPHRIQVKYKAAKLLLMPAVQGTGLIAGGTIRKVLELTGVKDILSKALGTSNKVNNSKAVFLALSMLKQNPAMIKRAGIEAERRKQAVASQPKPPVEKEQKPTPEKAETPAQ